MIPAKRERETLRYLGVRGEADEALRRQVRSVWDELAASVTPKSVTRRLPCVVTEDTVTIAGVQIHSCNLARHLRGCREVFLLAATLGSAADSLLRRYASTDISRAAVMQAACAAMIEQVCDDTEVPLCNTVKEEGRSLRPRFSPGYGDFALEHQRDLAVLLDCTRRIGLTLSDSLMLIPTKSVTAVIGIREGICVEKEEHKCRRCGNQTCEFREDG
ncbi:MAG: Vitamin B12 dependent methionine synthase activation subunit [Clostridiales bacterium]|nr:Vitamin B12 dependent methionine synthase activation subunit [Clostridiales bacterium]